VLFSAVVEYTEYMNSFRRIDVDEQMALDGLDSPVYDFVEQDYTHFIKYMGSKSKIMDFVLKGINEIYDEGGICDLFAGSASLAGAVRQQVPIHSNDIQAYSGVLANAYLEVFRYPGMPSSGQLIHAAKAIVAKNAKNLSLNIDYTLVDSIEAFNALEQEQQQLINCSFDGKWQFFTKTYSGTWWSAQQCLWIDALREVAEDFKDQPCYALILSAVMYAMAYTSQGTGHYAQYRDANTESGMHDISMYRKRSIQYYFKRKFDEVFSSLPSSMPIQPHVISTLDYRDCLSKFSGGTVYADPPYCFVHYSRFYHALETLVLYDNPAVQQMKGAHVKGRYREQRHQSPFCIQSKVKQAFEELFEGVKQSKSNLALSYSNTGMITIDELQKLASKVFPRKKIAIKSIDHTHMTLGRRFDRSRKVTECLLLIS
jgi:adenine-specific DNA-methyltransferase